MNKKGYTLIELLVAITIIAIISLIALPSIRRIQSTNRYKKYESYSQVIEKAAKAYVDSYKEDIFKDDDVNADEQICNKITLRELINKKLVKDSKINDSTCVKEDTDSYVEVSKYQNKYYYKTLLKCKNDNDKVVYKTPHYQKYNPQVCITFLGEDETPPIVTLKKAYTPTDKLYFSKTNLNNDNETIKIKVKFQDNESGLMPGDHTVQINWEFIGTNNNGEDESIVKTTTKTINIPSSGVNDPEERKEFLSDEIKIDDYFIDKELNGVLRITIKPIYVVNNDDKKTLKSNSHIDLKLDNNPPRLEVVGYQWKKENGEDIQPTSGEYSGLEEYKNNKWFNGKVLTRVIVKETNIDNNDEMNVSGIDKDSITYTTTGATQNDKNKKGTYRNIEAEGESTITYHACDKAGNCINSNDFIVKLDHTAPICTIPSDKNDADYIDYSKWYQSLTTNLICEDHPGKPGITESGCLNSKQHKTFTTETYYQKKESIGTIYDKAGNSTKCDERTIKLDKIAPTCTKTSQQQVNGRITNSNYKGTWINKGEIIVTGTCTDANSGCEEQKVQSIYSTDTNDYAYVNVRDNAGNTTTCEKQLVRIDKTPPICTWDPKDTRDKFFNLVASSTVKTTCTDTKNGSGCKKDTYTKDINYFILDLRGLINSQSISNDKATAGEVEDNAGNKTICPKVRPYTDDDCIYTDGEFRSDYYKDSLRGNQFFVINTLGLRPNILTELGIVGSALTTFLTFGMGGYAAIIETAIHADKIGGYRRYRLEDGQYKLCLDKSLDIMYDEQIGTFNGLKKTLQIVPELKGKYQYGEWPGIEVYTSQGT